MPTVEVPRAPALKPFTLILPYYCNPRFFDRQCAAWADYPADVQAHLRVIVVDDGSPDPIRMPGPLPVPLRVFRIDRDVRWNWLAARNIGAHHAAHGWLLLTDMDHMLPVATARAIIAGAHDPRVVYAFQRVEHTGVPTTPHSASFLMTRKAFWTIGGYDETLSGHYGTDGEYRRRLSRVAKIHLLPEPLVRHEYVEDSSTTRYLRKQPEDAAVRRIIAKRGPGWKPKVLTFQYHEIFPATTS